MQQGMFLGGVNDRLLHSLHLFYAGLLAFVLPFICWGAQATPGHPHPVAHFVFFKPPQAAAMVVTGLDAASYLATFGRVDLCSSGSTGDFHHRVGETPQLPAGRSAPTLIISLLLLVLASAFLLPSMPPRFSCIVWNVPPPRSLTLAVPTPPPR